MRLLNWGFGIRTKAVYLTSGEGGRVGVEMYLHIIYIKLEEKKKKERSL